MQTRQDHLQIEGPSWDIGMQQGNVRSKYSCSSAEAEHKGMAHTATELTCFYKTFFQSFAL